ncbi:sialidase family protein [Janthinobacterium sp.]|uniref:sialidase family protein n=1 Tax=Janthinobacterium sp. TaxID=1871054 RepID=UPI00293D83E0|nr:sialidase family protein [Janthinobacterium sp.]
MHTLRTFGGAIGALLLAGAALAATAGEGAAPAAHHQMKAGKALDLAIGVGVDAAGRYWLVRKELDGAGQNLALQSSDDQGKSWSAPRRLLRVPEAIAADGEGRPKLAFGAHGELYISYTKPLAKPYTGDIRFIRSLDGGLSFEAPLTVHANRDLITHRFESMLVDARGRIFVAWIDKRDLEAASARGQKYAGAAVYYAVSDDRGASFRGDYKLAEHSCECCRIGLALAPGGKAMALWRHVFEPNVRDHALAELTPSGAPAAPQRVTFDDWRVDACPHQGPALAYGADGTRHQAWFSVKGEEGGVYYANTLAGGQLGAPRKLGSDQAEHADIATEGKNVVLAWRQFDGKATAILGQFSADGGATWRGRELARTARASDHPRLLATPAGIVLVWRTQDEDVRVIPAGQEN